MKKDDFMNLIRDCNIPERFDQKLLDGAANMMNKWDAGLKHEGADREHLFENFALNEKTSDSEIVKKEKAALRCVASKIFKSEISKESAIGIMKNFNVIKKPGFRWLE